MTWDYMHVPMLIEWTSQEVLRTFQDFHDLGLHAYCHVTRVDIPGSPRVIKDISDLELWECTHDTREEI